MLALIMRHFWSIFEHCDFAYFLKNYPQKSNFRMRQKKSLLITTVECKVEKKYKFQFMKEVVKFLFPVWPGVCSVQKHFTKHWKDEVFKLVIQCWKIFIAPFLAKSLECLTLIALKIDAKRRSPSSNEKLNRYKIGH